MATKTANVTARVPFSLDIPDKLATRDSITQAEFDYDADRTCTGKKN